MFDVSTCFRQPTPPGSQKINKEKKRKASDFLNASAFICVRRQGEAICFNKVVLGFGSGNSCNPSHNGTPEAERACVSTLLLQNKKTP